MITNKKQVGVVRAVLFLCGFYGTAFAQQIPTKVEVTDLVKKTVYHSPQTPDTHVGSVRG